MANDFTMELSCFETYDVATEEISYIYDRRSQ